MLAAGVGRRLGSTGDCPPKCLLEIGGTTLLERHLRALRACGVEELAIALGYRSDAIEAALARDRCGMPVRTVINPRYEEGSIVTLWTLRDALRAGGPVLLMDADVLYDPRILQRLVATPHRNCFLLDRDFEPGDEPVKLCLRAGVLVEFRKQVEVAADYCGESVGFFRLEPQIAARLADVAERYVDAGRSDQPYEEALRDVLLEAPERFGIEDITGLRWIEIDFPEDVARAGNEILPALPELQQP